MSDFTAPRMDLEAEAGEDFNYQIYLFDNDLPIDSIDATSPITVHCKYHGHSTGDKVLIANAFTDDGRISNANGIQTIDVTDANTLTLNGTTTNGPTTGKNTAFLATPRNCTGGSVAMVLKASVADETPVNTPTITSVDATIGNYNITIPGATVDDLSEEYSDLAYDIFYTDTLGKAHKEARGNFKLLKSVVV